MGCNNKFEMFVPCGWNCMTSYQLRRMRLQLEALPFDWVGNVTLELAVRFIETHFYDYIVKDKLLPFADKQKFTKTFGMPSGIKFIHDFSSYNLEAEYNDVEAKYKRRIERFYKKISGAATILFVHCSFEECDAEKLLFFQQRLENVFHDKMVKLLYIRLNGEIDGFKYVLRSQKFDSVEINKKESDSWTGNDILFSELLSNYQLEYRNSKFELVKFFWRRKLLKLLVILICCCLPMKKNRHRLKSWYKQNYEYFKG